MNKLQENTSFIKKTAARLGFDYCGIAMAQRLDDDAARLERWLQKGMQGSMQYMEKYFELRIDPAKLVPGAKSVITLLKTGLLNQGGKAMKKIIKTGREYNGRVEVKEGLATGDQLVMKGFENINEGDWVSFNKQ